MTRWERFLRIILKTGFEPVETLLALQFFVTGLLAIPAANENILLLVGHPNMKLAFGLIAAGSGLMHLFVLIKSRWQNYYSIRKPLTLVMFVANLFIAFSTLGVGNMFIQFSWVAFLTLALISAAIYLNLSYRQMIDK